MNRKAKGQVPLSLWVGLWGLDWQRLVLPITCERGCRAKDPWQEVKQSKENKQVQQARGGLHQQPQHKVKRLKAVAQGLDDLHGNVKESFF